MYGAAGLAAQGPVATLSGPVTPALFAMILCSITLDQEAWTHTSRSIQQVLCYPMLDGV